MALQSGVTILNKYRIVKLLGEGGMARVWLAEELTFGKRLVALKEPRPNPLSDDAAEIALRYQREVQVCAELEQAGVPQIVRAITAEPYEEGLLLVMAYMPGGDLASLIKQNPVGLPPERAVAIALDVLAALAGAHSHPLEIIHRDVKPSNILFDKEGRAYLADFGLAQLAGVSGRSQLRGGQHPGTPQYMAPEQERSGGYLSPAADLFALGCVLWEMLTGKRYKRFRPGTQPGQQRAGLPVWVEEAVMRALVEDPWERWEKAQEMAEELRAGPQAAARRPAELEAEQRAQAEAERQRQEREAAARRAAEEAKRQQPATWQQIGIELVHIPAGEFLYGGDKRKMHLPEYWIARTPVTNAQYAAFVQATGYGRLPFGKENHPVVNVDWHDAQAFCRWAGLRLPTEKEWEKAARGTDGRKYPWGNQDPTEKLCNCSFSYYDDGDTTPVGQYPAGASPYGLLDMVGNVSEWCEGWYDEWKSEPELREVRGGSWFESARGVGAAVRSGVSPDHRTDYIGFRCARSP